MYVDFPARAWEASSLNPDPSVMRLPEYIRMNTASILAEWDAFARSIWPGGSSPSPEELRDHAEAILKATARDMAAVQSALEQSQKSKGLKDATEDPSRLNDASGHHAVGRAASGFDLRAVMAEYRALRASVVRLWFESRPEPDKNDLADITRFHEAMDQSLAAAVHQYSAELDKSRQMFLGILRHDLRSPVNAISLLAQSLGEIRSGDPEAAEIAEQIRASAHAVDHMLGDFMDFAVTRLGRPMPVTPGPMDLPALCREVVAETRTGFPHGRWHLDLPEELVGAWDRSRLRQLLSNLIHNACQHGDPAAGVAVSITSDDSRVVVRVHNLGTPIPAASLSHIFEPYIRATNSGARAGSLGLGLHIAREIAVAHGGTIEVVSTSADGTTFTVTLPRRAVPLETGGSPGQTAVDDLIEANRG